MCNRCTLNRLYISLISTGFMPLPGCICKWDNMQPNYITISQTVAEIWRFNVFFQNGSRPPSWICWPHIGTTHDNYFVVSIIVQNLVEIDAVLSIIWNFQYFASLAWKCLFMPSNLGFLGNFTLKMGSSINETHKRHTLARARIVWAIKHENPQMGMTCEFPEKRYK